MVVKMFYLQLLIIFLLKRRERWRRSYNNIYIHPVFSFLKQKARVRYCHSASSVCCPSVRKPFAFQLLQNRFMKLGRDEVLMVPYKCCYLSARSGQGRIQDGAKVGRERSPSSKISSSNRKATATNQMHSNDLKAHRKKCCYFLRVFNVFSDFHFLDNFNAISIDFYKVKCLIHIHFV